jgi:membrane protein
MLKKLQHKFLKWIPVVTFLKLTKRITLPGFEGIPIYNAADFFIRGLQKGSLQTRASALSFDFFLAIFPAAIFIFTLIAYIPVEGFQDQLMILFSDLLPKDAYEATRSTLEDIIKQQRSGLLSIGFIVALYFSTNGVHAMMDAFNKTYHTVETRPPLIQRAYSIMITLILSVITFIAILLIIFGEKTLSFFESRGFIKEAFTYYLLISSQWIVIIALIFFAISFLYYFGPSRKTRYRFFSVGSTIATLLIIITSLGFSFFIDNFSQYNKLYGSIGALIIILLWIRFNSMILLIGFELNASIHNAKHSTEENLNNPS